MKDEKRMKTPWLSKHHWLAVVVVGLALILGTTVAGAVEIKVALVTPEGSTWTRTLNAWTEEVAAATGGAVTFKVYAGGISGDELDVLRKMQAGRIQAAGFSGVGLGTILPAMRILEAPLLFDGEAALDRVKEVLFDGFAADLEKQGYILLGFAEAGFVYFFAKNDISSSAGLAKVKMWSWKGDPVAQAFLETHGIRAVPLHVGDVNTGLETGMIDAFYAPPLAALVFQWQHRVRFMLDQPMVNSTGALLLKKTVFDALSPAHQAIVRDTARKRCRELVESSRRENRQAMEALHAAGITVVKPEPELIEKLRQSAGQTHAKHQQNLYSPELFAKVQGMLNAGGSKP